MSEHKKSKNIKMKIARIEKGLTQEELADRLSVSRQTICLIELGKYNPSIELCIKICKCLNKKLDEIFGDG